MLLVALLVANPTTAYLEDCLKPPAAGRGTLCAMLLHGDVEALQKSLATPVALGLPLPPFAAAEMPRSLRHKLVFETQQVGAQNGWNLLQLRGCLRVIPSCRVIR